MSFQRALLEYFDQQRRDLPWRHEPDPYRIWISEVMLQQTRVETVRAYYERWIRQFPDLQALARAPIDDVLKAWQGLGYYTRARNLHRAAQVVCERYQGTLPATFAELHALPGIGEYTAGAVASIAYRIPAPAVDGNVKRVLARLLDAPRLSARAYRDQATRLVPQERPGDFNQSFMELGATICTPRAPRCPRCPVSAHCLSFARGTQLLRPERKASKPLPDRHFVVLLILDAAQRVLVRQRPEQGLLAGLWEFPTFEAKRPHRFFRQLLGETTSRPRSLGTVMHAFSHFRAHYAVHFCRVPRLSRKKSEFMALSFMELDKLALPTAQHKILRLLIDVIDE
ncbi:MAG: A/G-specific adenine glycosylase [Longimicrobiales bacterium]